MPDSASKKTWRDVVAAAPTGSLMVDSGGSHGRGAIVGVHVDDEKGPLRLEYSIGSRWLKKEAIEGQIRVPLSVEFSEEDAGNENHRFVAIYDSTVITIYVRRRFPLI